MNVHTNKMRCIIRIISIIYIYISRLIYIRARESEGVKLWIGSARDENRRGLMEQSTRGNACTR